MFQRTIAQELKKRAQKMPVIAIIGPWQSGKTTLAQATFTKHTYISLEDLKKREFAEKDPHVFFETYHNEHGIILDEIQQVPQLLSYIQVYSDQYDKLGYFILNDIFISNIFFIFIQLIKEN